MRAWMFPPATPGDWIDIAHMNAWAERYGWTCRFEWRGYVHIVG